MRIGALFATAVVGFTILLRQRAAAAADIKIFSVSMTPYPLS
jgi:hypothetical protein